MENRRIDEIIRKYGDETDNEKRGRSDAESDRGHNQHRIHENIRSSKKRRDVQGKDLKIRGAHDREKSYKLKMTSRRNKRPVNMT